MSGTYCIVDINDFLGTDEETRFKPSEWSIRTPTGQSQRLPGQAENYTCGLYVISHAMSLPFGYGSKIYEESGNPLHIRKLMKQRGARMGFGLLGVDDQAGFVRFIQDTDNLQCYPVVNTPPEHPGDQLSSGWEPLTSENTD